MAHPHAQESLGIQQQTGFLKRQYKGHRESQTSRPHLCAWGDHGTDPHESNCKSYSDKEVIQNRQQGCSQGKSCLSNLVAFKDGVTETLSKGRLASVI